MKFSKKPVVIHVNSNQDSLSQSLMNAIRTLLLSPLYDHMTVSTLIGVLELLKFEMLERNK